MGEACLVSSDSERFGLNVVNVIVMVFGGRRGAAYGDICSWLLSRNPQLTDSNKIEDRERRSLILSRPRPLAPMLVSRSCKELLAFMLIIIR